MKVLSVIVVYDRDKNVDRWLRVWNAAERDGSLCVVRNVDGGELRYSGDGPLMIDRPNVGYDIGVYQDIIRGRLDVPEWDWMFVAPDDWLPMSIDYLKPFKDAIATANVGLVGARSGTPDYCRSGGFMIRRDVANRLRFPADPIDTKEHCYQFEYGDFNMLQQIRAMGVESVFLHPPGSLVLWDQGHEAHLNRMREFPKKDISDLMQHWGTDKSFIHSYGDIYAAICYPFKHTNRPILELGVQQGKSLRAWRDYFVNATIYGIDSDPNAMVVGEERITTECLNILDHIRLAQFAERYGPFQMIVDDASHLTADSLKAYSVLRSFLEPRGLYVIEDVQNQESIDMYGRFPDATVYDLRNVKGRYDDVLIVLGRGNALA